MVHPHLVRMVKKIGDPADEATVMRGTVKEIRRKGPVTCILVEGPLPLTLYAGREEMKENTVCQGAEVTVAFPSRAVRMLKE